MSLFLFFILIGNVFSEITPQVEYGDNYIVIEADETSSDLGLWVKRTPEDPAYYGDGDVKPLGEDYLEFTGNNLNGGSATSPLTYTFTCPKTANYRLAMRMYQPLKDDEPGDKRNDTYVRLEGNYATACKYPKEILETDHKFWGRGVRVWGSMHSLEAHIDGQRFLDKVVYKLIEGEEYTFTMSGRAQGCSIDYLLFYEESLTLNVTNIDIAAANSNIYQPGLGLVDPTSLALNPNPAEVRVGTTITLDILAEPTNARKKVTWSTSNDKVLTVDEFGLITAVGLSGESATITASSTSNDLTATCEVSIIDWYAIPVNSISITPQTNYVVEGSEVELTATALPKNADDPSVKWSSSNTEIASVDENTGKVTTLTSGSVSIRATSIANDAIYDEASIEIEKFVEPTVSFDIDSKYVPGNFIVGGSMEVSCNYHAGNFATVKDGIKFWLRELNPKWTVIKETYNIVETSVAGSQSGSTSVSIPLEGVTATEDLATGNFYFLFVSYNNSKDVTVDYGINPIKILRNSAGIENILSPTEEMKLYPNPTKTGEVSAEKITAGNYKLSVLNLSGSEIYTSSVQANTNNSVPLNLNKLKAGIYIVTLKNPQTTYQSRITITN